MEWKCRTPEKDEDIVESLSKDRDFILLSQDISGFRYIGESKIKEKVNYKSRNFEIYNSRYFRYKQIK